MKLNNSYILFDSGKLIEHEAWAQSHVAISGAIQSMRWPDEKASTTFRIPRIVTIKPGRSYIDPRGKNRTAGKKGYTLRNGVKPLRNQFRRWMEEAGWKCEQPCSLKPSFEKLRANVAVVFKKYPELSNADPTNGVSEILNESVGDFDYWFQTQSEFRTVVEWETGNISSSHRSLNKMCLALIGGVIDAGVLVVPSKFLAPHLTDRIGNIRELQPYFYFWNLFGTLITSGLLTVIEVEHDELFESTDARDFVPMGAEGNSAKLKRRVRLSKKR